MATYPNNEYKNEYGMLYVHGERIIKQAIADAGLLTEDPEYKIIVLKESHIALIEEITKTGEEISRIAGRLMRQHLRKVLSEKDIRNALKVYTRKNGLWFPRNSRITKHRPHDLTGLRPRSQTIAHDKAYKAYKAYKEPRKHTITP